MWSGLSDVCNHFHQGQTSHGPRNRFYCASIVKSRREQNISMLSTPGLAVNERRTESQRFEMTFGHIIELHKPPKTALSKHGVPAWIFRLGTDLVMLIKNETSWNHSEHFHF